MKNTQKGFWNAVITVPTMIVLGGCTSKDVSLNQRLAQTSPPGYGKAPPLSTAPIVDEAGKLMSGEYTFVAGKAPSAPVPTRLLGLPAMEGVRVRTYSDGADIEFDRVAGAKDYRVYALPSDSQIQLAPDGTMTVPNAVYRCAGERGGVLINNDGPPHPTYGNVWASQLHGTWEGQYFNRADSDSLLGYVYKMPAADRLPVYGVGDPSAGFGCYAGVSEDTRARVYTTSLAERLDKLALGWRDDGIRFYVPAHESGATHKLLTADGWSWQSSPVEKLIMSEGSAEATAVGVFSGLARDSGGKPMFAVLAASAPDAYPLYRINYTGCFTSSDVLAVGQADFDYLRFEGTPTLNALHWSGLTQATTLVIEALDQGCPYPGALSPESIPARDWYKQWLTMAEMKAHSPTGEVYLNGQFDPANKPKATARSFIQVAPQALPKMDFFADFNPSSPVEVFTPSTRCSGWARACYDSPNFFTDFYSVEGDRHSIGVVNGELMVRLADVGADVNGMVRITSRTSAQIASNNYLHVSMDVDNFIGSRRYPQIIVSDRPVPVQDSLDQGTTVILQTRGDWPGAAEIQLCDHRIWAVNNQCPTFNLTSNPAALPAGVSGIRPFHMVSDGAGLDRTYRFDGYISSQRAYVFMNGSPYGCAIFPAANATPHGQVSVTWGHVLYHSGVSWWPFDSYISDAAAATSEKIESLRHYDNLGFSSGVALPTWDEQRFPCETTMQ